MKCVKLHKTSELVQIAYLTILLILLMGCTSPDPRLSVPKEVAEYCGRIVSCGENKCRGNDCVFENFKESFSCRVSSSEINWCNYSAFEINDSNFYRVHKYFSYCTGIPFSKGGCRTPTNEEINLLCEEDSIRECNKLKNFTFNIDRIGDVEWFQG